MNKRLLLAASALLFCTALRAQVIMTCAGGRGYGFGGDGGPAIDAMLTEPYGINLDDSGNLYICDINNNRIRKVTHPNELGTGIITTIAGNGTGGYNGDGFTATFSQLSGPIDVAIDHHGNVYIADEGNYRLRKVDTRGIITTVAGTGTSGYNGDNMPAVAAQLSDVAGVAVDKAGNIYITDPVNYRIRKIDTAGIITTIAGTGILGFSPDGSRADTSRIAPYSIRISANGAIYFSDSARIRKIDSAGIITTVAGNGIIGFSGDGGLAVNAEIWGGGGIALDSFGNLYIGDGSANRIRKVDTTGIIITSAGNGLPGSSGDGGPPLLAEIFNPQGVAVNSTGVYCSDQISIRLVTDGRAGLINTANPDQGIVISPNPCHNYCSILIRETINEVADVAISDVLGRSIYKCTKVSNQRFTVQLNVPPGVYTARATTLHGHFIEQIIIQ